MCTSLIVSKKIVVILSMGPKGGGEGRGTQQGEREEKGGENDSCWVRGGDWMENWWEVDAEGNMRILGTYVLWINILKKSVPVGAMDV